MSTDPLHRAAALLRNPLLCNWDHAVAHAIADLLELAEDPTTTVPADAFEKLAKALLRSFGQPVDEPAGGVLPGPAGRDLSAVLAERIRVLDAFTPKPAAGGVR